MGSFAELFLERLEEAMETSANMPLVHIIREYSELSAKLAMEEWGMGRDGAGEGVAVDGEAVNGEAVDEEGVGVAAPPASEEYGAVLVVEGLGAMEIEEDGEGVGVAAPPASEEDGAVPVVEEGLVAMEIEEGGEGVAAPPASEEDGAVPVVEEGLVAKEIEEDGEGVAAPPVSEEDGAVPVVEDGLGAMEIEEDGEGLAAADGVGMAVEAEGVAAPAARKFRGVRPPSSGVFIAELRGPIGKGKRVYLGSYSVAEEAAWAYDAAARLVLGKRAKPNFPHPPPMPIPTVAFGLMLSYFDISNALHERKLAARRRAAAGQGQGQAPASSLALVPVPLTEVPVMLQLPAPTSAVPMQAPAPPVPEPASASSQRGGGGRGRGRRRKPVAEAPPLPPAAAPEDALVTEELSPALISAAAPAPEVPKRAFASSQRGARGGGRGRGRRRQLVAEAPPLPPAAAPEAAPVTEELSPAVTSAAAPAPAPAPEVPKRAFASSQRGARGGGRGRGRRRQLVAEAHPLPSAAALEAAPVTEELPPAPASAAAPEAALVTEELPPPPTSAAAPVPAPLVTKVLPLPPVPTSAADPAPAAAPAAVLLLPPKSALARAKPLQAMAATAVLPLPPEPAPARAKHLRAIPRAIEDLLLSRAYPHSRSSNRAGSSVAPAGTHHFNQPIIPAGGVPTNYAVHEAPDLSPTFDMHVPDVPMPRRSCSLIPKVETSISTADRRPSHKKPKLLCVGKPSSSKSTEVKFMDVDASPSQGAGNNVRPFDLNEDLADDDDGHADGPQ
ncbi:hypothetical protein ABZP36_011619 [Zizania latifolia]